MFPVSTILNVALPHQKIREHERSQSTSVPGAQRPLEHKRSYSLL